MNAPKPVTGDLTEGKATPPGRPARRSTASTVQPRSPAPPGTRVNIARRIAVARKLVAGAKRAVPLFANARLDDVHLAEGRIVLKRDASVSLSIAQAMQGAGVNRIEEVASSVPEKKKQEPYARFTHSAIFAEK